MILNSRLSQLFIITFQSHYYNAKQFKEIFSISQFYFRRIFRFFFLRTAFISWIHTCIIHTFFSSYHACSLFCKLSLPLFLVNWIPFLVFLVILISFYFILKNTELTKLKSQICWYSLSQRFCTNFLQRDSTHNYKMCI